MTKAKAHKLIRKILRYLGVIFGIQFLFWTLGGLYFSWTNIKEIRGEQFFMIITDKKLEIEMLVRPKKPMQLPKVISEEEVAAIINATGNLKHKAMLSLMYSAGLRRGEVLNMKASDIDRKRMLIMVRQAKGLKDRVIPLSPIILEMLREYYLAYKPVEYLFEGQYGGKYSERSIELILKKAVKNAGIQKMLIYIC